MSMPASWYAKFTIPPKLLRAFTMQTSKCPSENRLLSERSKSDSSYFTTNMERSDGLDAFHPPTSTVHGYFKRFEGDDTWVRIHDAVYRKTRDLEGREESPCYAIIDSQSAKTGPDAREKVGFDAGKKVKGRKRHILVDTLGLILKCEVHSAGIQDRDGAALVFDKLINRFPFIEIICGDGGYQGPRVRNSSPRPMEIIKRNQVGFEVLRKRWIVERTFAWLGINRRLSKDFERFAKTSLTFIQTAMIKLMIRRLARFSYS